MAERIGSILVRRRLITAVELDEALRAQLIYGGRLGTILVELDLLELDDLAEALAEQLKYPVVSEEQLDNAPAPALKLLTPEQAQAHQAFPFALEGRRVKMAMASPHDPAVQDALAFITGLRVIPFLVPELRLAFVLDRRYGVKRKERFIRLAPERHERRRPRGSIAEEAEPSQGGAGPRQGQDAGQKEQLFGSLDDSQYLGADEDEGGADGTESAAERIQAAARAMAYEEGEAPELLLRSEDLEAPGEESPSARRREGVPVEWDGETDPGSQALSATGSPEVAPADPAAPPVLVPARPPAVAAPAVIEAPMATLTIEAEVPDAPASAPASAVEAGATSSPANAVPGALTQAPPSPTAPEAPAGSDSAGSAAAATTQPAVPTEPVTGRPGAAGPTPPGTLQPLGVPPTPSGPGQPTAAAPMAARPPPPRPPPGQRLPPGYGYPPPPYAWPRWGSPPPPQWGASPPPPWARRGPPPGFQPHPARGPVPVIRSRGPHDEDRLFDEDALVQWTLRSTPYAVVEERPPAELQEAIQRVHATRRSRPLSAEVIDRAEIWEFLTWSEEGRCTVEVEADGRPRDFIPLSSPWEHTEWEPVVEDAGLPVETAEPLRGPASPWAAVGYAVEVADAEVTEASASEAAPEVAVAAHGDSDAGVPSVEVETSTQDVDAVTPEAAAVVSAQDADEGDAEAATVAAPTDGASATAAALASAPTDEALSTEAPTASGSATEPASGAVASAEGVATTEPASASAPTGDAATTATASAAAPREGVAPTEAAAPTDDAAATGAATASGTTDDAAAPTNDEAATQAAPASSTTDDATATEAAAASGSTDDAAANGAASGPAPTAEASPVEASASEQHGEAPAAGAASVAEAPPALAPNADAPAPQPAPGQSPETATGLEAGSASDPFLSELPQLPAPPGVGDQSQDPSAPDDSARPGPTSLEASPVPEELRSAVEAASCATEISAALLSYCADRFGRAFVLVENGGAASVWRGIGDGADDPELSQLKVPLDVPSALKSAASAAVPIHLETPEGPVDEQLFAQLAPRSPYLVLAAVSSQGAPVAFVYAESALEPLTPEAERELQSVVELAGRAHDRLRSQT